MKCRLLYLVGQLGPGGSERQLYSLLEGMDRSRYGPQVIVWNYRDTDTYVARIRELGVPIHPFCETEPAWRKLAAIRQLVVRLRPEVLHSYSFFANLAASWATMGTSTVAIGAVRSDFITDKSSCRALVGTLSARWPRAQIYNSFVSAANARSRRRVFIPSQICIVRNALDLTRFPPVPLAIGGDVHILGIGSLLPVKRWDRLLETAAGLTRQGLRFRVTIAGDGPLRAPLEQQARHLGIAERVRFPGYSDNVPGLLREATFLAHTSDNEGCPNAVVEAMAGGRAVVATDAGDVPSLVEEGRTGFVVKRGDDSALEHRVATLIRDRDLCRRMGQAGRLRAEREFGVDRLLSETFAAYTAAGWRHC